MKRLSLCAVILAFILGCGNELGSRMSPSEALLAQNSGEVDIASGSCHGPFISELRPFCKDMSNYRTELFLQGTNRPTQASVNNETCNELSRYLSASTWMENGHKIANEVELTINFGFICDNSAKVAKGGGIRAESATLNFLDGSLTQKLAHVELRCPALFTLRCPAEDNNDCFDYTIFFGDQKCTFSGLVANMVYSDHKRGSLEIFGEIIFKSAGSASMTVTKASWMMVPEL